MNGKGSRRRMESARAVGKLDAGAGADEGVEIGSRVRRVEGRRRV